MWRRVSFFALLLTLVFWTDAAAATVSFESWLQRSAGPSLVDKLANHPRFKGRDVRFGTLYQSEPVPVTSRFEQDIVRQLTNMVLTRGTNDVRPGFTGGCRADLAESDPVFLVIEVRALERGRHMVRIAGFDLDQASWIAGLSQIWEGRLSATARKNLQALSDAEQDVDNVLLATQTAKISRTLLKQLRCTLRSGLDGGVSIDANRNPHMQRVLDQIRMELSLRPNMVFVTEQQQPVWKLGMREETGSVNRWVLSLSSGDVAHQTLGFVYVGGSTGAVSDQRAAFTLSVADRPDRARCPRQTCIELNLNLRKRQPTLVFSTNGSGVVPLDCSSGVTRREPGDYRFRVNSARGSSDLGGEMLGFYVLTSNNSSILRSISRRLVQGASKCGGDPSRGGEIIAAVSELESEVAWQVLHFRRGEKGLVRL